MARGRKQKPKELKKLQGSRDRQAEKAKKENVETMGKLPILDISEIDLDGLCDYGKRKFSKLYELLNGIKVLSETDIEALKILCDAYAQYWTAKQDILKNGYLIKGRRIGRETLTEAEFDPEDPNHYHEVCNLTDEYLYWRVLYATVKNPSGTVMGQAWEKIKSLQGEFGLTPASRTKIQQNEDPGEDPLDNLLNFSRDK